MGEERRIYVAIDLKSFYASVECVERGLDPLNTHLVVADVSRTDKTICLAVTPSLKAAGVSGRPRLFEVVQRVRALNAERRRHAPGGRLVGKSADARVLKDSPELAMAYIVASPRMSMYMAVSARIYRIYLNYVSAQDIHVYSIDEVFIDVTGYLELYGKSPRELAMMMIRDVLKTTGITATAGIGTNMYLAKVAMDIQAKHCEPDAYGVRIAELDERKYREQLWTHTPMTDFWRIGPGTASRLKSCGLTTMGELARYALEHEDELYRLFGVNAELLIDHAWGWEPCTMADIKRYRPESKSMSSGQVLPRPYDAVSARCVLREMVDDLVLDLVSSGMTTRQIVLTLSYDVENLTRLPMCRTYRGDIVVDRYGRRMPRPSHGSLDLGQDTSSWDVVIRASLDLFDRLVDSSLLIRKIHISVCHLVPEQSKERLSVQLELFGSDAKKESRLREWRARERPLQEVVIRLREKYGRNIILKGMNFEENATAIERHQQIGGHRA